MSTRDRNLFTFYIGLCLFAVGFGIWWLQQPCVDNAPQWTVCGGQTVCTSRGPRGCLSWRMEPGFACRARCSP